MLHGAVPVEPVTIYRYDTSARSLQASYADLVGRARKQDRLLVSWSRHELNESLAAELPEDLHAEFVLRFRDGKATAKRWLRQAHPDVVFDLDDRKRRHTLARYLELTGYEVPEDFVGGQVGSGIQRVREGLTRCGAWDGLAEGQKRAWWRILGHNLHDCLGLRHVVRTAAFGLSGCS